MSAAAAQDGKPMPDVVAIIRSELTSQHMQRRYPEITPDSALTEDLSVDALDRICIALALEEAFAVEIPDAALERWQTVADIVATVTALAERRASPAHASASQSSSCLPGRKK